LYTQHASGVANCSDHFFEGICPPSLYRFGTPGTAELRRQQLAGLKGTEMFIQGLHLSAASKDPTEKAGCANLMCAKHCLQQKSLPTD